MTAAIFEAFRLLRDTHPAAATFVVQALPHALRMCAVRGEAGALLWCGKDSHGNHSDAITLGGSPELN